MGESFEDAGRGYNWELGKREERERLNEKPFRVPLVATLASSSLPTYIKRFMTLSFIFLNPCSSWSSPLFLKDRHVKTISIIKLFRHISYSLVSN